MLSRNIKLFFVVALFSNSTFAAVKCPKNLRVGWELSQPYQFLQDGKVVGIDMEILDLVLKQMGCEVTKIEMPWKRLLAEVKSGKMELAAGVSPSNERRAYGYMSASYNEEPVTLYVRKKDSGKFSPNTLEDLTAKNLKFGVLRAAYYGPEFERLTNEGKFKIGSNLIEASSEKKLIQNLLSGRIDGVFIGGDVVNFNKDVVPYKKAFFVSDTVFMFSKKLVSEEFVTEFSNELTRQKQSGQIKSIIKNYLKDKSEKYSTLD